MTLANYSIDWNAQVSGVSSGGIGVWVVTGATSYVPATTANYNASPAIHGVLLTTVTNGVATVQFNGPIPPTVTGFSASAVGFARLNLTTGMAEYVANYATTDIRLGPVTNGTLRIDFSGDSASTGAYSPLLATELDENAADNSAALTAFCDRVDAGRTGIIPAGTYYFTETAYGLFENGFYGVTIEGESSSIDSGTGGVVFVWNGARVSGSAASLECLHKGAQDVTYTATRFDYVRLSGITGASAASVGKRYRIAGTTRSYWSQVAICVAVESATSIVLGMYWASSNVSIVGDTDASNGSITWEEYNPLWSLRGRDLTIRGIQFKTAGGATRKPSSLVEWTASDSGGVATHIELENLYFGTNDGVSVARSCVDIGRVILPNSANVAYYLLEGGYRRPFVPYQCDYLRMKGCVFYFQDTAFVSGNTSGQERANVIEGCEFVGMTYGVNATSWFNNTAEQLLRPASICFTFLNCSGGTISGAFLNTLSPNGQNIMAGCYFEGPLYRLATCGDGVGGASFYPLIIRDCYFDTTGHATDATGWLYCLNGPLTIDASVIRPLGTLTDFKIVFKSGNGAGDCARAQVINSVLPSETEIGADLFSLTGAYGLVSRQNCVEWSVVDGATNLLPDKDYVAIPASTDGGKHLQKVKSLSASWTPNVNFIGTATVTGAATTATWTFGTAEASATSLYGWAVPISSTGGPAAGSNRVLTCVVNTTTAVVTVETAPGGVATVTFAIFLARGP